MTRTSRFVALFGAVVAASAVPAPGVAQSPVVEYRNYAAAGARPAATADREDVPPFRWVWSAPAWGASNSLTLPAAAPVPPARFLPSASPSAPGSPSAPDPALPPPVRPVRPQYHANGGFDINAYLGATAFYDAGYTGSRAVMANIEGAHLWNGHETLGHVTRFITGPGVQGFTDGHATGVAFVMGGRPTTPDNEGQRGVAYGATLWSGALATDASYNATFASFFQPYVTAFRTGVNGQTADVSNSSYGDAGDSAARSEYARALDALARDTGKVMVFAAGNSGPGPNTVLFPATSYNVISVAALTGLDGSPPYHTAAGFSSRGPQDVFVPTGSAGGTTGDTVPAGRVRVDLAAPGTNLFVAASGGPAAYSSNGNGTSYAAPNVAAGVALMIDAGRAQTPAITHFADIRVVKAVLMTAADKTAGWDNGQAVSNGVVRTTRAVDVAVGAGRMNLTQTLPFYASAAATRDVPGTAVPTPAAVQTRGYDFAVVSRLGQNDYVLPDTPLGAARLTVTLAWLINRGISGFAVATPTAADFFDHALANLNLQVYRLGAGGEFTTLVAESVSPYNNTEHLQLNDLSGGRYGLRVMYPNDVWNFAPLTFASETYGLAWTLTPVPEPGAVVGFGAVVLAAVGAGRRFRRAGGGIAQVEPT